VQEQKMAIQAITMPLLRRRSRKGGFSPWATVSARVRRNKAATPQKNASPALIRKGVAISPTPPSSGPAMTPRPAATVITLISRLSSSDAPPVPRATRGWEATQAAADAKPCSPRARTSMVTLET
jgi:hypothetical protein